MRTPPDRSAENLPLLARALRRALLNRQRGLDPAAVPCDLFAGAVAACDAADRAYRAAIETRLERDAARRVLAAIATFRERVVRIRDAAARELREIRTLDLDVAEIDPLDVVAPRADGLAHVDAVRLADAGDRARRAVAAERDAANAHIAPLLDPATAAALVAAKRARVVAFHGAIHAALIALQPLDRLSATIEGLADVADGWY